MLSKAVSIALLAVCGNAVHSPSVNEMLTVEQQGSLIQKESQQAELIASKADYAEDVDGASASFSMKVHNVSYPKLAADAATAAQFMSRYKEAVADEAGFGVKPEHVGLRIWPNTVIEASIVCPLGSHANAVQSKFSDPTSFRKRLLEKMASLPNAGSITTGTFDVNAVPAADEIVAPSMLQEVGRQSAHAPVAPAQSDAAKGPAVAPPQPGQEQAAKPAADNQAQTQSTQTAESRTKEQMQEALGHIKMAAISAGMAIHKAGGTVEKAGAAAAGAAKLAGANQDQAGEMAGQAAGMATAMRGGSPEQAAEAAAKAAMASGSDQEHAARISGVAAAEAVKAKGGSLDDAAKAAGVAAKEAAIKVGMPVADSDKIFAAAVKAANGTKEHAAQAAGEASLAMGQTPQEAGRAAANMMVLSGGTQSDSDRVESVFFTPAEAAKAALAASRSRGGSRADAAGAAGVAAVWAAIKQGKATKEAAMIGSNVTLAAGGSLTDAKAVADKIVGEKAYLMFDCDAGYVNWARGWSAEKKTWCCKNMQKGCAK